MEDQGRLVVLDGLTESNEAVYLFVVSRGKTLVDDVASRFDLPVESAAAELESLRALGLVSREISESGYYSPVDPRFAVTSLLDRLNSELGRVRELIPVLGERFDRTLTATASTDETLVLSDRDTVAAWYVRLQHQALRDFMVFDRPPYVSSPLEPLETTVIGRGVLWRAVYAAQSFERDGAWDEAIRLTERGEQARIVPELAVKLAIADRTTALVSLSVEPGRSDAIVTSSAPLVAALCELFEATWSRAVPVQQARDSVADLESAQRGPTSEEQSLLALMSAGVKDEAAARHLGISVRSLRRRSHDLLVELGADNRFQAGVEAARRGWV